MYLDGSVLAGAALRLLQLLLNPFITAGLQSAAYPNNGLPYQPMVPQPMAPAVAPPRQFGGADILSLIAALGAANPAGSFSSTGSLGNGGPMGSFTSSGSLGSSGSPMGSFMSSGSGSLGANGNPMGSFMSSGSGSLGANGNPMGSFMSSGSGSLGANGNPMGSFMSSGPGSLGASGNPMTAFPGTGALGAMQAMPAASLMPGSMTAASMAAMPPMQIAPWVVSQPLAALPNAPNGPVFVPPSAVPSLLSPPASSAAPPTPSTPSSTSAGSLAAGALSVLEEAIAPYLNASSLSSSTTSTSLPSISSVLGTDTASPMPMGGLISLLGSFGSGIRVVIVNFAASVAVMAGARLLRLVVENLPIILNVVGLTRASMARVIVEGVTRAQCLERAACVLGQHASTYPSTPEVLRWLRSPDPSAAVAPEHPVWKAFRSAAEGTFTQCEAFSC